MCGLVFVIDPVENKRKIEEAVWSLRSRGPDEFGIYEFNNANLCFRVGHTRLAIRGLNSSNCEQPLISDCERYVLAYNGEIYNTNFLANKFLNSKRFAGDTPLLFELLKNYGQDIIKHIEGMFAFVFIDKEIGSATIARDHVGIKPIYYTKNNGSFIIGSTINSIVRCGVNPQICKNDLFESLSTGFVSGDSSGFEEIKKLKPGTILEIDFKSHLMPKFKKYNNIFEREDFTHVFPNIIKEQSISDVNSCIFFSGGVDSTVLAAETKSDLLHLEYNNSADRDFAAKISKILNRTIKYKKFIRGQNIFEEAKFIAKHVEEPISDYTFIATHQLSQFAKDLQYKVALSGMGADEVFSGYPRYTAFLYLKFVKFFKNILPNSLFQFLLKKIIRNENIYRRLIAACSETTWAGEYIRLLGYFSSSELEKIWPVSYKNFNSNLLEKIKKQANEVNDKLIFASNVDFDGFLQHNLVVTDKASMHAGVEVRVPFLAEKIIILKSTSLKKVKLIKLLGRKIHDKTLFKRSKQGFNPSLIELISNLEYSEIISEFEKTPIFSFLDKNSILSILQDHYKNSSDRSYQIWQLIFISQWLQYWQSKS